MPQYNQFALCGIFLGIGVALGICFGILNLVNILFNRNRYVQLVLDILSCLGFAALYLVLVNIFNWGQIRIYLLCVYTIGIIIERKTVGKLFANYYYKLYNWLKTKVKLMSNTKFGKFIKR